MIITYYFVLPSKNIWRRKSDKFERRLSREIRNVIDSSLKIIDTNFHENHYI